MGCIYGNGLGVQADAPKAVAYLQKAGDFGPAVEELRNYKKTFLAAKGCAGNKRNDKGCCLCAFVCKIKSKQLAQKFENKRNPVAFWAQLAQKATGFCLLLWERFNIQTGSPARQQCGQPPRAVQLLHQPQREGNGSPPAPSRSADCHPPQQALYNNGVAPACR